MKEKGITLIALVVTIVVLLILAGVSINALFGNSGIIEKAKDAQNRMNNAQESDLNALNDLDKWIEYQVAVYPKITTGELAQLSGKSVITIKRRIAKMPHIVYVGSGYSGHWEVRKKE
mgnify:CR=1 FL=1